MAWLTPFRAHHFLLGSIFLNAHITLVTAYFGRTGSGVRCCYLLHDLCVGRFLSGQIIIPILVCGNELSTVYLSASCSFMRRLARWPASSIVEAEQDRIDLRLPLQQLQHRLNGGAAAGHIAVALPVLRMERDVGEHIDGSFEHIEAPICADVVEAVAGIAALHI